MGGESLVLAFPSGKGGVGKTTVAVNLAAALALRELRVVLIDTNFALPNLHLFLDVVPERTLTHYMSGDAGIDDIVGEVWVRDAAFDVIPSESLVDLKAKIDLNLLSDVINRLKGSYDILLLDMPPGLSKYVVLPLKASDAVVIVTSDFKASHSDALRVLKLVQGVGKPHLGFIVNMCRSGGSRYFETTDVFSTVPYDPFIRRAYTSGRTIFHTPVPGWLARSKRSFEGMAEKIAQLMV
ncbi:ATPases involved in chromosome partitioning [Geoglobus ahangari]|uniref:ATPases involved in chromosome partitioning n=1 Tax=Geoglobus ahangari TaxID=113653 RepID=A0A0F7IEN7_9EURY|nr:MinD/ParA family protein [Geoglobus ahangari]AKG91465.1 ATPases involved in chromosome partitioning [Geoglobus ahangari]